MFNTKFFSPRSALLCGFLLATLGSVRLHAQAVSQISGTVTDQSGDAILNAKITVTQTDTGVARTTTTDSAGSFIVADLPTGPYRVEASAAGFQTYAQSGIELQVSSSPVLQILLRVGEASQRVEVQANASSVEIRNMGVGNVIENQRILDLPLNGRDPNDLILLSGAAIERGSSPTWGMQTGYQISVAGGLSSGTAFTLDGGEFSNMYDATGFPLPFPDALQEFKVETSALDAAQGLHAGAQVNGVTKSGTNTVHGDAFEFLRNGDLNARNFFAARRDSLKRNQFGGTVGGPIKKDKVFFFAGYQGTWTRSDPSQTQEFVPTAQMLAGNFTTYVNQCGGTAPVGSVNNQIDPALFSPAALKIASHLPKTNDPCGRVLTGTPVHEDDNQIVAKGDYQLSASQTMFARYIGTWHRSPVPFTIPGATVLATPVPGIDDLAQTAAIGHTWLISSTTVNSLRVGMNREATNHPGASFFGPTDVGINAYSLDPHFMSVAVTGGFSIGSPVAAPITLYSTTEFLDDDVNLVRGNHQFALGVSVQQDLVVGTAHVIANPSFTFPNMPSFLLGNAVPTVQSAANNLQEYHRFFGLYGQDTWKVSRRFTLNYGLRWEPFFPNQVKDQKVNSFSLPAFYAGVESKIYPTAPVGFSYPGDRGFNGNAGSNPAWKNFAPRVGFAWDPNGDGKTSIRGGAGISYDFANMQQNHWLALVPPFGNLTLILDFTKPNFGPSLDNPWSSAPFNGKDPFPYLFTPGCGCPYMFGPSSSYETIPKNLKNTQVQQWNVAIQRQVTKPWFVSASYVGSHAIHGLDLFELNPQVVVNGKAIGRFLSLQNPTFGQSVGELALQDYGATQYYNGLLLNTTYRIANANINANYTWSHCTGDTNVADAVPGPGTNTVNNYLGGNRRSDRGNCVIDRRQVFNLSAVAQAPNFQNNVVNTLASKWTLSGIYQYRTGAPLSLSNGIAGPTGLTGAPNLVEPNNVYCNGGCGSNPFQYLNPAAFAPPGPNQLYGNLGYFAIRGPAFWGFDISLARNFRIREGHALQVRADAFNLLNSERSGDGNDPLPSTIASLQTTRTSSQFGQILTSLDPRIIQLALKYTF
jgi:hypothetical protein